MPAILGFVAIFFLIYLAVSMIIPTVAGVMATTVIGKTAKLDDEDSIFLALYFYFIQGTLVGVGLAIESDPETWWGAILYFLTGLILWPLPYSFALFGQMSGGDVKFLIGILACSFVITQLIAVLMILKKAKRRTDNLN